jgi:hypothetical protein
MISIPFLSVLIARRTRGQIRHVVKGVNARRAFNPSVAAAACRLRCRRDVGSTLAWILHCDGFCMMMYLPITWRPWCRKRPS